jgi:exodeoxyribonuclease V alpha subunit
LLPAFGFDTINDTQVIAALNVKGTCSKLAINKVLQDVLNATGKSVEGKRFRVRDKVIYTKNMELAEVRDSKTSGTDRENPDDYYNTSSKVRVANGDIGRVIAVDDKATIVKFEAPQRVVRLSRDTECFLDLAYAVSCHKFQGSESPVVIVVLDPAASTVCCREWVYTAISRAKRFCIIVGPPGLAERFCKRVSIDRRKTFLAQLLKETT